MLSSPKGEIIWAVYKDNGVPTHAITSTPLRDVYFLCEVDGEELRKTKKKAENPMQLEKFIPYIKENVT